MAYFYTYLGCTRITAYELGVPSSTLDSSIESIEISMDIVHSTAERIEE